MKKCEFNNLKNKKILVTGGNGFLGKQVCADLFQKVGGESEIITFRSAQCDLRNTEQTRDYFNQIRPDYVISLAARLGGIGDNLSHPADYFYDSMMIGLNTINCSKEFKIKKIINIGTVCSYPNIIPIPFKEEDLWMGYPEETNAPYGISKKAVMVYAKAMEKQFGLKSCNILLSNLYGPGDDFRDKTSHVIPSLIKKIVHAQEKNNNTITVWGNGSASRDFLFVKDASLGIIMAAEMCDISDPINLGTGYEISISALIEMLIKISGTNVGIKWDETQPNGQPRRVLETSKAKNIFGFKSETPLVTGLTETWDWYLRNRKEIDNLGHKYEN